MSDPLPVRPTYFATPKTYRLEGDALIVTPIAKTAERGSANAATPETVPLQHITAVRLSHSPARFQLNRFRCTVSTRAGAKHVLHNAYWESPLAERDLSAEYSSFIRDLCARVADANPRARFLRGRSRAALIVENSVLLLLVAILIAVWIWLEPSLRWFQIVNLALIVLFAPFAIISWRRNRAGVFDPRALPEEMLPATIK